MKNIELFKRPVTISLLIIFAAVSFSGLTGCSAFKKKYEKNEAREYKINTAGKNKLSVDNTNGKIRIFKSDKDSMMTVKADIVKYVTKKEMDTPIKGVDVSIDSAGSEIKISESIEKDNRTFKFEIGKSTTVNFDIYVPAGISVNIDGTNSKLEIEGVSNDISADMTNGNVIIANAYGNLKFELTNGNLKADVDSAKGIDFETVNGNITLNIGKDFSGVFKAETLNGKIIKKNLMFNDSDESKKNLKGSIGKSEAKINLSSTNGKITIEKK
ncbi:MAG: hypothetical protein NTV87_06975 [Ignavibacteriae bacterium]|nr:hypothetical protein [Ignavibacteriota bacterium]